MDVVSTAAPYLALGSPVAGAVVMALVSRVRAAWRSYRYVGWHEARR